MSAAALIQAFDFESQAVRVVVREEQPWFVAADVCRVLNLVDPSSAVRDLEDDEKMTLHNERGHSGKRGGAQFYNVINESGLYALIFKSRKAEARRFRKWVTSEVLPAIRKDGEYRTAQALASTERGQLARLRKLLLETAEEVKSGKLTAGKAQAIAIAGQRYLETLKLEAEAIGYETVLGLRGTETTGRLLSRDHARSDAAAELLQDLPQPAMPGTQADEPDLQGQSAGSEEDLGAQEPEAGQGSPEGLPPAQVDPRNGTSADAGMRRGD